MAWRSAVDGARCFVRAVSAPHLRRFFAGEPVSQGMILIPLSMTAFCPDGVRVQFPGGGRARVWESGIGASACAADTFGCASLDRRGDQLGTGSFSLPTDWTVDCRGRGSSASTVGRVEGKGMEGGEAEELPTRLLQRSAGWGW